MKHYLKYYQNEPKLKEVSARNNLPKTMKDGAPVINLDEYKAVKIHLIALYKNDNSVTCFDNFGVEQIPREILIFIGNKNILIKIFRIQAYDLIMCEYFCIGFIDSIFKEKSLIGLTNLFSPHGSVKKKKKNCVTF